MNMQTTQTPAEAVASLGNAVGLPLVASALPGGRWKLVTPGDIASPEPMEAYEFLRLMQHLRLGVEIQRFSAKRCAWAECERSKHGRSRYCAEHLKTAGEAFDRMKDVQVQERERRFKEYQDLCEEALAAASAAAQGQDDGRIGNAWCHVLGANKAFPRWAKDNGFAVTEANRRVGGVRFVPPEDLPFAARVAWAEAHAAHLKQAGIEDVSVVSHTFTQ